MGAFAPPSEPLPPDLDRAALDAAPVGIVITDGALDEPSPRMLYVNPAFCAMTGYASAELLGRSPRFLQGARSSRIVLARLRAAIEADRAFEDETWNYRADGTPFMMQWSVTPLRSQRDGTRYFLSVHRDVTEHRRLEALAEASNQMENVGYVFAGIRHELGNPINSIKAAVTLLRRGIDHYTKERVAGVLDRVLEELQRVEYLLRELRSFNAYEDPMAEAVEIAPFLERFASLVTPDFSARGCSIELHLEEAPSHACFDGRGLHQVLLNLTTNAVEAISNARSDERGTAPGCIAILVRPGPDGGCTIHVDDNGPGMSPEILGRVFMPFFTTKHAGTGLGLALAQRVLARMGASIGVQSQLGAGTTFSIELPSIPDPAR